VLPLYLLVRQALAEAELPASTHFIALGWNSLRVSALAAALAVVLATLVAYAVRLAPGTSTRVTSRVLALGYAVPGSVLAVGVLLPVGAVDHWLAAALQQAFGVAPRLLLTGTVVALIYAYLVRYFAVAWNGIEPGFARITPSMDAAARSLGATPSGTLARVHAPLLVRSAAAAARLVFVDVMKERPARLGVGPC